MTYMIHITIIVRYIIIDSECKCAFQIGFLTNAKLFSANYLLDLFDFFFNPLTWLSARPFSCRSHVSGPLAFSSISNFFERIF